MSDIENKEKTKKLTVFDCSIVSLGLGIGGFLVGGLITKPFVVCGFLGILGFAFGLIGLYQRRKIGKRLVSDTPAIAGVVINLTLIIISLFIFFKESRDKHVFRYRLLCGININGLGKAIEAYSNENEGLYPSVDNWCDLLVETYVSEKQFICKGAAKRGNQGRCHYAMDPNCEPNSPPDMVLLFETKGGWNQYGGPEILTTENHQGKGCNILFNDCHVEFIKTEQLDKLMWEAEEIKLNLAAWSEGKAYMKTIAVAIRAYAADPKLNTKLPKDNDLGALGFEKYDQEGQYFKPKMFSFKVSSLKPLRFRITATNDALTPVEMTLDEDGNWTEVQSRK